MLWGLQNVRTSVQRVFGHNLHKFLSAGTQNRFQSFASGLGITLLLQSSTATALIMAALCGSGLVTFAAGVAIMLGADVGTALLALVLSLKVEWLAPFFVLTGFVFHRIYYKAGRKKYIGRLLISLGLMLFALNWIKSSTAPLAESEALPVVINALENDAIMGVMVAALLTWMAHSSLAIVLLLVSFAAAGLISPVLGIIMVLGANLGGAIAPIVATLKDSPKALRVPVANMIMRLTGVILILPFVDVIYHYIQKLEMNDTMVLITAHIGFNTALAIAFLPFVTSVSRFVKKIIPDKAQDDDPSRPQYLDYTQIDTPSVALTSAARETLRVADIVQSMLSDTRKALGNNDEAITYNIRERDNVVDQLYKSIKHYLAKISEETLDEKESKQYLRIMSFIINLEAVGDIIDKSMMDMALKKIRKKSFFSKSGWEDITEIHNFVIKTMSNAHTVFLNENPDLAREMIKGKDWIRRAEMKATESHLDRIREGVPETVATSSLHLDIIRDYRRINSHIATVAYPILEETGQLPDKRLRSRKKKDKSSEKN